MSLWGEGGARPAYRDGRDAAASTLFLQKLRVLLHGGERGAADAERDIRGFAAKMYTDEGNWDLVGNNTPVLFFRDPLKFSDLNHAAKRDPRTNLRSAQNNRDFWTLLPEAP